MKLNFIHFFLLITVSMFVLKKNLKLNFKLIKILIRFYCYTIILYIYIYMLIFGYTFIWYSLDNKMCQQI